MRPSSKADAADIVREMDTDDKTKAINGVNGSFNNLLAKPMVSIFLAAIMGAGSATGIQLSIPARTDAFTSTDALKMEYKLLQEIDKRIGARLDHYSQHELIHVTNSIEHSIKAIRQEIPPQALRDRVVALEEFARRSEPTYNPPSRKWRY